MQSVYSGSALYHMNDVTGEIQMSLSYSDTEQTLKVSINKVRGLTAPKDNESSTNPYVTMVMLITSSHTSCTCVVIINESINTLPYTNYRKTEYFH